MTELIMALLGVAVDVYQAIQHAVSGDKDAALDQALVAQRKLSDAIARTQLTP